MENLWPRSCYCIDHACCWRLDGDHHFVTSRANLSVLCFQQADNWEYTSTRPNLPRDTYPFLLENIDVVIYNGDWDACVPYTDNEAWTSGMGLEVDKSWHSWSYKSIDDESTQVRAWMSFLSTAHCRLPKLWAVITDPGVVCRLAATPRRTRPTISLRSQPFVEVGMKFPKPRPGRAWNSCANWSQRRRFEQR